MHFFCVFQGIFKAVWIIYTNMRSILHLKKIAFSWPIPIILIRQTSIVVAASSCGVFFNYQQHAILVVESTDLNGRKNNIKTIHTSHFCSYDWKSKIKVIWTNSIWIEMISRYQKIVSRGIERIFYHSNISTYVGWTSNVQQC